jgi:hypothetical protein
MTEGRALWFGGRSSGCRLNSVEVQGTSSSYYSKRAMAAGHEVQCRLQALHDGTDLLVPGIQSVKPRESFRTWLVLLLVRRL